MRLRSRFAREECLPAVAPAQWRDKDEELYMPVEHAAYLAKPDYKAAKKHLTPSTAPGHNDPLSRHRLSYLSGGGGSGKTTRAIELFRQRDPSSSPRPIAWPKRCEPGAFRPRPTTASSDGVAKQSGRSPQRLRTPSGGSCVSDGTSSSCRTKPRCGASSPCR